MTVYANDSQAVQFEGGMVSVRKGDSYEDSDRLVAEFPWLFDGASKDSRRSKVEQATASPGELRNR